MPFLFLIDINGGTKSSIFDSKKLRYFKNAGSLTTRLTEEERTLIEEHYADLSRRMRLCQGIFTDSILASKPGLPIAGNSYENKRCAIYQKHMEACGGLQHGKCAESLSDVRK